MYYLSKCLTCFTWLHPLSSFWLYSANAALTKIRDHAYNLNFYTFSCSTADVTTRQGSIMIASTAILNKMAKATKLQIRSEATSILTNMRCVYKQQFSLSIWILLQSIIDCQRHHIIIISYLLESCMHVTLNYHHEKA